MTGKKLTLWVCLLIHKIAGLHASHLQYSSFDPGHECSNLDILVEDIFLWKLSWNSQKENWSQIFQAILKHREDKYWNITFPHWSDPAALTRPTNIPSSVVKAPPLSPCGFWYIGWMYSLSKLILSFSPNKSSFHTWHVPFVLPPAQRTPSVKPSPFSSIFFMQSAFVMIGTWDKQTWGSKHEYSEDLQPWLLEEHQSSTIHPEHPHLQVPILRTALQGKI